MVTTIYCKCIQGNNILSILYRCLLYPTNILYISSLRGLFIFVYICMKFYLFSKKIMYIVKKKIDDTKDGKSKDRQYHGNQKKDKRWSTKHYTETKDWETRTPEKPGLNSDVPERKTVSAQLVAPVVLFVNETNISWYEILLRTSLRK